MANEITIVVSSKDEVDFAGPVAKSKAATTSMKGDLDGLASKSKETGGGFKKDTDGMGKAMSDFDRLLTNNIQDGETAFQSLQRVSGETKSKMEELRGSFRQFGRGDDFDGMKAAEDDLKTIEQLMDDMAPKAKASGSKTGESFGDGMLEKIPFIGGFAMGVGKMLTKVISDAEKVGEDAGTGMAEGMTSAASAGAQDLPQLFTPQGAIGAAVVAAIVGGLAVVIGGAIAVALTLGVGFGFIGIAALILKNNAGIVASFTKMKNDIVATMSSAAAPLIGPFEQAMDIIDKSFQRLKPEFTQLFAALAPAIKPIITGIMQFIAILMPQLVGVAHEFTSMFNDPGVESELKAIAGAFAIMFGLVTKNSQATTDFFRILVGLILSVVVTVDILIEAWDALDKVFRASGLGALASGVGKLAGALGLTKKQAAEAAPALAQVNTATANTRDTTFSALQAQNAYTDSIRANSTYVSMNAIAQKNAAQALQVTTKSVDNILNVMLNSDNATLTWHQDLTNLTSTLKKNKDQLDINKAAGQSSRAAVLQSVGALQQLYDTTVAATGSTKKATDAYNNGYDALVKQMHAAGLTDKQIQGLIGTYKNVPKKVNTEMAIQHLTSAINNLDELLRLLNNLPSLKTVHVRYIETKSHSGSGPGERYAHGGIIGGAATGAIRNGLTWVGEHGAELVSLPPGSMVHSNPDSMRMASQAGGGGSAPSTMTVQFSGNTDTIVATMFQKLIRNSQIQLYVGTGTSRQRVTV